MHRENFAGRWCGARAAPPNCVPGSDANRRPAEMWCNVSYAYVVWTEPRTGGTTLSAALKAASEHPNLEDEPFQYGVESRGEPFRYGIEPHECAGVYERWLATRNLGGLKDLLTKRSVFKHILEPFEDTFNVALAVLSTQLGYRHIHLIRRDKIAQLVSRGVAEQLFAWQPEYSLPALEAVLNGTLTLFPVNVQHLVNSYVLGMRKWKIVEPHLGHLLCVTMEDVTTDGGRTLAKIGRHLGIRERLRLRSGQDTQRVWHLLPNIGELRAALTAAGVR